MLLILLAVAGLGLGTGSHCADHTPSATRAAALNLAVDRSVTSHHRPTVVTDADTVPGSRHDDAHPGIDFRGPADTADDCRPASPTAANIVAAGAGVHLPAPGRTVPRGGSCLRPARPRLLPAITLTDIGVSRT